LFRNLGERRFEDVSKALLMRDSGWGWGAAFADFDHDGVLDIFAVSGFRARGVGFGPQDLGSARLFRRAGSNPATPFVETSASVLPTLPGEGRGVALLDFDADGDQDLFVGMHRGASLLLRNDQPAQASNFVRMQLVGKGQGGAIGARVTIAADGVRQLREVHAGSGYLGQSEGTVHAGVPAGVTQVAVTVRWPDAQTSRFEVETGRTWRVYEP
jgi:hypothetical protein